MPEEKPTSRRAATPRQMVALVLVVFAGVFIVENLHSTRIRFLVPIVTAPLWLALFAAMLLGVGIGVLLARQRSH